MVMRRVTKIHGVAFCLILACAPLPFAKGTVVTVTNTNDSGPGSLRNALAVANDGDTIDATGISGVISLNSGELLVSTSVTINGPGADLLAVDGNMISRGFRIPVSGKTIAISGFTIRNGHAGNAGGGIDNENNDTLVITNCIISSNTAGLGGGMFNGGPLTIGSTTVSGNSAANGGGIYNSGGGMATITNSTVSGNSAGEGGGIFNIGVFAITNSTLSNNSASLAGGVFNNEVLQIGDTILNMGASGANISNFGTVTSLGYNLSSDSGGGALNGPGDQINTNPLLGPLQDNGGPTLTHALSPGSPAIDTGDPNFTPPPFDDQRGPGYPRVVNGRIDKGSFEVQAPSPTPTATPCASVGSWTEQAPYPIAVSGHAVVSVGGNVYSFGGIVNNTAITNAYKYSPTSNSWTPIASLPAPRGWFSGTSDGTYVYLLGGVDQNFNTTGTLWRYDPVSNTYNTSLPSYAIPTYFHATAYLNGKIYRIAGAAIGTDFHVEVYTIATNTWSMAANYPFANHNLMAVALGNYIYAGGGNASPDKTYRYDPSTNTWDDAAVADLPAGRSAAASGAYNGRWILAGGDVNFAISTSVIAWDPATNTWSDLPNMVQARDYLAGAIAGQSFYAVAGSSGPGTGTNDNQQYTETLCGTPTPTATASPTLTPTATPTPTPTCPTGYSYTTTTSTGTITQVTTDTGNHCDDCMTPIICPFPISFYGTSYTGANLNSNGDIQFVNNSAVVGTLCPYPYPNLGPTIFLYQDDLRTDVGLSGCVAWANGCGIFTGISGTAPNRVFNIEWHAVRHKATANTADVEIRFYENTPSFFDVFYNFVGDNGSNEGSGVQASATGPATTYSCLQPILTDGLKVT